MISATLERFNATHISNVDRATLRPSIGGREETLTIGQDCAGNSVAIHLQIV